MELHNLGAAVRNAAALVRPTSKVAEAGEALLTAAAALVVDPGESEASLKRGVYPPKLQAAAAVLEAYRVVLLTAARQT